MCREARINGRWVENVEQLTAAIKGPPVLVPRDTPVHPHRCLCAVDMEATAARYGLIGGPDDEWYWTLNSAPMVGVQG